MEWLAMPGDGWDAEAEPLCLRFINTVDWRTGTHPEERLHTYGDLLAWAESAGILTGEQAGSLAAQMEGEEGAAAALAGALALREALYRVFIAAMKQVAPAAGDLALVNAALREALAGLRLVVGEQGAGWAWAEEAGHRRLLWPVVLSAARLLTSGRLSRVRQCADDACGWLFLDLSRNGSRRWCSMKDCGNRAKARRHYRRRRTGGAPQGPGR